MTYKPYSEAFKQEFLERVKEKGASVAGLAKEMNVPNSTAYDWVHPGKEAKRKRDARVKLNLGQQQQQNEYTDFRETQDKAEYEHAKKEQQLKKKKKPEPVYISEPIEEEKKEEKAVVIIASRSMLRDILNGDLI